MRVLGGDTRVTPYDRSTGASRSTTIAGLAVLRAAADIRSQLLAIGSRVFDLPEEALRCARPRSGTRVSRFPIPT